MMKNLFDSMTGLEYSELENAVISNSPDGFTAQDIDDAMNDLEDDYPIFGRFNQAERTEFINTVMIQ